MRRSLAVIIIIVMLLLAVPVGVSADPDEFDLPIPTEPGDGIEPLDIIDILLDIGGAMTGLSSVTSIAKSLIHIADTWINTFFPEKQNELDDTEKVAMYLLHYMQEMTVQNEKMIERLEETALSTKNTAESVQIVISLWVLLMVIRFLWKILWGWLFSQV